MNHRIIEYHDVTYQSVQALGSTELHLGIRTHNSVQYLEQLPDFARIVAFRIEILANRTYQRSDTAMTACRGALAASSAPLPSATGGVWAPARRNPVGTSLYRQRVIFISMPLAEPQRNSMISRENDGVERDWHGE
jgi:hypothetical protein